jgi:hypothetical protein
MRFLTRQASAALIAVLLCDAGFAAAEAPKEGEGGQWPAAAKAGLFEILGAMVVAPAAKTADDTSGGDPNTVMGAQDVLIPLPLTYRDQAPLSYELQVTPPSSAAAVEIVRDGTHNSILKVKLAAGRRGSVKIAFRSIVLIGPSDFTTVPKEAPMAKEWPKEVAPWLAATWCADADHERIQALTADIRAETSDVLEAIRRVRSLMGTILRSAKGRSDSLTAVESLDNRGSCTSCANLVAALLRASGVPARIVASYPSWSGPLQTHYIVEAYVPGYGWYPIESTLGQAPWPNTQQAQVAIIPPQHEAEACAGPRVGVAGGVPYLSLTELPGNDGSCFAVGAIKDAMGCDHHCRALTTMEGTGDQWNRAAAAATTRWNAWLDLTHELTADGRLEWGDPSQASQSKSVDELLETLE